MEDKALQRLNILNGHLVAPSSSHIACNALAAQPTVTSSSHSGLSQSSSTAQGSSTYASATGQPSSYARVHGEVSKTPVEWRSIPSVSKETLQEVKYEKSLGEGIAKIIINRPEKRNAFTPRTVQELSLCFADARDDPAVGVVILTGEGSLAFCSGGDQSVRGKGGYVGTDGIPRLNVLDLQMQIRRLPKPVVAMVAGYAVGGGHILHMVCDITIAADNAVFGQTGPKVGSFDAGYGSTHMARLVGQKKAREIWFFSSIIQRTRSTGYGVS
ncbi:hypothetical protein Ndes2526A_g01044 [Nannochloris sp. 'desiccata']